MQSILLSYQELPAVELELVSYNITTLIPYSCVTNRRQRAACRLVHIFSQIDTIFLGYFDRLPLCFCIVRVYKCWDDLLDT